MAARDGVGVGCEFPPLVSEMQDLAVNLLPTCLCDPQPPINTTLLPLEIPAYFDRERRARVRPSFHVRGLANGAEDGRREWLGQVWQWSVGGNGSGNWAVAAVGVVEDGVVEEGELRTKWSFVLSSAPAVRL